MLNYIARRFGFAVFVLWGAVTVIFVTLRLVPGDPALVLLGPDASADEVEAVRAEMGLTAPIWLQYVRYLWSVVRLDFGDSVRLGGDAMTAVVERLPMTALLGFSAVVIAVVAGVVPGSMQSRIWAGHE